MTKARCEIRVGMSGWTFPPWRGHFYPKGLKQKEELHLYFDNDFKEQAPIHAQQLMRALAKD